MADPSADEAPIEAPDDAGEAAPGSDEEPAAEEPALSAESAELWERVRSALGDAVVEHAACAGDLVVRVRRDAWPRVAQVARDDLECDYLSFISGIDWMPRPAEGSGDDAAGDTSAPVQPTEMRAGAAGSDGRFQVFARVQSTRRPRWGVTFKADVDEADPEIASWVSVYPGADWHERECWEMYGFRFAGHPALRGLYLPSGFEGHPLRKDFPLLAREVKPWPGIVDVEDLPPQPAAETAAGSEPSTPGGDA